MMTFTTSLVTTKQMHLGAFPSMGANWHRSSLIHATELCTLLKSDRVLSSPWDGPSGTGEVPDWALLPGWEDMNWLGAELQ